MFGGSCASVKKKMLEIVRAMEIYASIKKDTFPELQRGKKKFRKSSFFFSLILLLLFYTLAFIIHAYSLH